MTMKRFSSLLVIFIFIQSAVAIAEPLPGMPPIIDPQNIYAADGANNLSEVVKNDPAYLYVPNTISNTVQVFDQKTYKLISRTKVGREPQHVVPSWDLKTLYANSDKGNSLTAFDPRTGKVEKTFKVLDPYNLYFTPDGKYVVVMSEAKKEIIFRDPHTFTIKKILKTGCSGVNHADWTADGTSFIASCEFSGQIIQVDTQEMKVINRANLPRTYSGVSNTLHHGMRNIGPKPQDVKISPDGKTFYIADMMSNGVWVMPAPWGKLNFIKTGLGTHGLYVTRDAKYLVITNRDEGTLSLLRFSDNSIIHKWKIPGGGSPDMGGISTDGKIFWVSGRYNDCIYAISLEDGHLITKIKTDRGPHGLAVWPQPGRYSLGHTGIFR